MRKYKIAVYTIALNEEKHVKRWFDSAKDADLLVIADTGSTDNTRFLAKSLGIEVTEVEVNPWRFDVARNASLALIPEDFDICIQLDMDEVLSEGWRKIVEDAYDEGNFWPIYKHVTVRDERGNPKHYQHYFKIHPRKGFHWKYPIHEVLVHEPSLVFNRKVIDLEVDHIKDISKSRKSYLDLLEKAVQEEPNDWRMNHYLNREYFYNHDWLKVLQSGSRCEELQGGWDVERASTYMWASEAAFQLKMSSLAEDWARKATETSPHFYEVWHWRAHIAHLNKKWPECLEYAEKRQSLERQNHHLVKPEIWDWWGFDLIALASHNLGKDSEAAFYGEKAFFKNPENQRLRKNLDFYRAANRRNNSRTVVLSINEKLVGFPPIRVISLTDAHERKAKLTEKLKEMPELRLTYIESIRSQSRDYQDIHNAVLESHLKALGDFVHNSNDEWTIIAEDDINFELVTHWPFTWQEKMKDFNSHNIEIAQLCLIVSNPDKLLDTELHPRKSGIDWSAAAFLVSRAGAIQILNKTMDPKLPTEENLFNELEVFSEALFVADIDNEDAFHLHHSQTFHKTSFEKALTDMQNRHSSTK